MLPLMKGCGLQKYAVFPIFQKVREYLCPLRKSPELNAPFFAVAVCGVLSLLIQMTFVPGLMVMLAGLNLKPWIKTVLVGCFGAAAARFFVVCTPTVATRNSMATRHGATKKSNRFTKPPFFPGNPRVSLATSTLARPLEKRSTNLIIACCYPCLRLLYLGLPRSLRLFRRPMLARRVSRANIMSSLSVRTFSSTASSHISTRLFPVVPSAGPPEPKLSMNIRLRPRLLNHPRKDPKSPLRSDG
jgi:hypothetical protein